MAKLNLLEKQGKSNTYYRMRAIITRGLYFFYSIFHCGLYCRAVYNVERVVFHGSFLSNQGCIHGCIKGCLFTCKNKLTFFTNIFIFSLLYFCLLALALANRNILAYISQIKIEKNLIRILEYPTFWLEKQMTFELDPFAQIS